MKTHLLLLTAAIAFGQQVRFADVEPGVRLEVLDWGGVAGRNLVLLTGSGNTAHVYDDFAPKLKDLGHVYAITRRGSGASSHPESGYDDQRLADDVLAVLDSLRIAKPVLIGHSMAGNEMTTLAHQHSDRLSGLVYLDAGADPKDFPASDPKYMELARKLPPPRGPLHPTFPEAEQRTRYDATTRNALKAIGEGTAKRDYSNITVPVLSLFAVGSADPQKSADARAFDAATLVYIKRYENSLKAAVPSARILELPGADHYLFISNEADVLREIRQFLKLR
jgi:pimeloyl-ACP methyl ester carboxylesterase